MSLSLKKVEEERQNDFFMKELIRTQPTLFGIC